MNMAGEISGFGIDDADIEHAARPATGRGLEADGDELFAAGEFLGDPVGDIEKPVRLVLVEGLRGDRGVFDEDVEGAFDGLAAPLGADEFMVVSRSRWQAV